MNMKLLIILILATIYGSIAVIIVAAIAHDLVVRGRTRRRDVDPQGDRHPDRSRFPLDEADSPILLDDADIPISLDEADSPILLDDADIPISLDEADSPILLDDEDAKATRGQGRRLD